MSKLTRLATAVLLTAALAPASAAAAPAVDGEFTVTEEPKHLTLGPDGNVWAALGSKLAKITPAGDVTEYDPANLAFPVGITAGPDGNLWVTQTGGVVKVPPGDPETGATAFPIAAITTAQAITTGPDGKLWTGSGDQVVEIPPADPPAFEAHTVADLSARGIASGGDGNLWVADFGGKRVLSVTTAGVATPYPVGGGPQGIAAGPGTQIAYANSDTDPQHVGRISPGGEAQKTPVPGTDPFGITLGTDGAYWFTQFGTSTVSRMTVDGQVTTLEGLSAGSGPRYIARGPGNTLWVSLETAKKVARITGVEPPQPVDPGPAADVVKPVLSGLAVIPNPVRSGRRIRVRFTLSEAASVRLVIRRVSRRRAGRSARTIVRAGVQGRNVIRLGRKPRRPGRYRVVATATDAAGNVSQVKRKRFRVRRR